MDVGRAAPGAQRPCCAGARGRAACRPEDAAGRHPAADGRHRRPADQPRAGRSRPRPPPCSRRSPRPLRSNSRPSGSTSSPPASSTPPCPPRFSATGWKPGGTSCAPRCPSAGWSDRPTSPPSPCTSCQHRAHRRDLRHRRRPAVRLTAIGRPTRATDVTPISRGDAMPWFPDFFSAVELARRQTRAAGLADPVGQYFGALENGDARVWRPPGPVGCRLRPAGRGDPWPPAAAAVRPAESGLARRAARADQHSRRHRGR